MTHSHPISVLSIAETLTHIQKGASVARFGDGEIDLMTGRSIPYQDYDPNLAAELSSIFQIPSSEEFLVCLPDVFEGLDRYTSSAQAFWNSHFKHYDHFYQENAQADWYGNTFLSRPYMDLADKSQAATSFAHLQQVWDQKDILIVEGQHSRSGVGNDLFANARSISRIICPARNAFSVRQEIYEAIVQEGKDKLILLMLGPTAKVLAYQLYQDGYQAIDLGHIDSEYEWYRLKATHKVKFSHKHTAEHNYDQEITPLEDAVYTAQIVRQVGMAELQSQTQPLISIIVPVYNVAAYLPRCLDSILKQAYSNFELLLINDGSTDDSARICLQYAEKDTRIRLFHQKNAGVSAARNFALSLAKGDYLTFIDSDDFVEPFYLEHLYTALTKNRADISVVNFTSFNEERQSFLFFTTKESYFERTYTTQEWLDQENTAQHNLYMVFTFSPLKLFKRELFDGVFFPLQQLREDDATIYKVYLKAQRITFANEGIYYYSQRKDGLSRTYMLEDIASMIRNAEERIALLASLGYDTQAHVASYVARLRKCQTDALKSGQTALYQQLSCKLDLFDHHQKEESR